MSTVDIDALHTRVRGSVIQAGDVRQHRRVLRGAGLLERVRAAAIASDALQQLGKGLQRHLIAVAPNGRQQPADIRCAGARSRR